MRARRVVTADIASLRQDAAETTLFIQAADQMLEIFVFSSPAAEDIEVAAAPHKPTDVFSFRLRRLNDKLT